MSSQPYVKGNFTHYEIPNIPAQERARQQVSPLSHFSKVLALLRLGRNSASATALPPPSVPTRPEPLISIGSSAGGPLTSENHTLRSIGEKFKKLTKRRQRTTSFGQRTSIGQRTSLGKRQAIRIDVLPDDVLVEIFYFCVGEAQSAQAWQSLVHVCRQWRWVVFGSPRRLNLQLVCTPKTPARDTLDAWPPLPLLIQGRVYLEEALEEALDNIIAVLERSDRVRIINLITRVSSSHLETISAAMQDPFPELTYLHLTSYGEIVLPDSFLGGYAPRLQFLCLSGIPFPGLSKLLFFATHLVDLHLLRIPQSGYISPEGMATALSTLISLETLRLGFESPLSRPDRETRPSTPLTRSVLPVLTYFQFKGDKEYMDNLMAHINAPRLNKLTHLQ